MLFDMLTADAASKHGHEFSDRQPNRWPVPRRSPLRVLPYGGRPRLPARPRSVPLASTMAELKEEPEELDEKPAYHDCSVEDFRIPGAFRHYSPPATLAPDITVEQEEEPLAQFLDADNPPLDDIPDETYLPTPILEPRSRRSKTHYSIAHPPPSSVPLRKQGIIRPRVLFQLQSLSTKFHKPVYEISPLSRFECPKKLGKRLSRLGRAKVNIAVEDLAVLEVGNHNVAELSNEVSELSDSRDVLGILSPQPLLPGDHAGRVQILLDDVIWEGTLSGEGKYDLRCLGSDAISARWYVPKAQRKRVESSAPSTDGCKFYFAAMLPQTTKHPTLASLTKLHLDIYDTYSLTSGIPSEELQPSQMVDSIPDTIASAGDNESGISMPVDESHRKLIIVSAFWIMLCEGWSPHYSFPTTVDICSPSPTLLTNRSMSLPVPRSANTPSLDSKTATPRSSPSPAPEHQCTSGRSSLKSVNLDASTSGSKRISFPSFSFGRSNSSNRPLKFDDVDTISHHSSVATSTTQARSDGTAAEGNPDLKINEEDSVEPTPDPTAQFRHVRSIEDPSPQPPSRPPIGRLESIIRRNTVSPSATPNGPARHRSRSISWNWNLAIPSRSKTPLQDESGGRHRTIMRHDNAPLHGFQDSLSEMLEQSVLTCSKAETVSVDKIIPASTTKTVSLEGALKETTNVQATLETANDNNSIPQNAKQSTQSVDNETKRIAILPEMPPVVVEEAPLNDSDRRSSTGSSDIDIIGLDQPYWKDFDRLQTGTFWQHARQLQSVQMPEIESQLTSSVQKPLEDNTNLEGNILDSQVTKHVEIAGEATSPQRAWFAGLRHMGRRNHG